MDNNENDYLMPVYVQCPDNDVFLIAIDWKSYIKSIKELVVKSYTNVYPTKEKLPSTFTLQIRKVSNRLKADKTECFVSLPENIPASVIVRQYDILRIHLSDNVQPQPAALASMITNNSNHEENPRYNENEKSSDNLNDGGSTTIDKVKSTKDTPQKSMGNKKSDVTLKQKKANSNDETSKSSTKKKKIKTNENQVTEPVIVHEPAPEPDKNMKKHSKKKQNVIKAPPLDSSDPAASSKDVKILKELTSKRQNTEKSKSRKKMKPQDTNVPKDANVSKDTIVPIQTIVSTNSDKSNIQNHEDDSSSDDEDNLPIGQNYLASTKKTNDKPLQEHNSNDKIMDESKKKNKTSTDLKKNEMNEKKKAIHKSTTKKANNNNNQEKKTADASAASVPLQKINKENNALPNTLKDTNYNNDNHHMNTESNSMNETNVPPTQVAMEQDTAIEISSGSNSDTDSDSNSTSSSDTENDNSISYGQKMMDELVSKAHTGNKGTNLSTKSDNKMDEKKKNQGTVGQKKKRKISLGAISMDYLEKSLPKGQPINKKKLTNL